MKGWEKDARLGLCSLSVLGTTGGILPTRTRRGGRCVGCSIRSGGCSTGFCSGTEGGDLVNDCCGETGTLGRKMLSS
jgi:hypothetical protein